MIQARNKFDTLQETSEWHTPNNEYENFVATHIEAATECIPNKARVKCKIPWESVAVEKKWDN